ncbi:tetratricopeptide (TPR) repeat protein [Saccharothrix tamanrassetensis]|uniref:Tetratricopeptide (TPR) repeat protein n=1 Tax=Saccharothrix tamanrassetensis TaxID=1051531 RepID=A0A841CPJ3_9PSEU|nr:CHAT domain-containing protein [Saccharothrix tamanrassetensis]MBB5959591.1 tetratricopeptide (TPR) repeat protein [Saccharothrix tamanrassetensis]
MDSPLFLSYRNADVDFAEHLARGLEAAGEKVFLYDWDVHAGESRTHRIDQAIRGSETAIVVVGHPRPGEVGVTDEYAALAVRAADGRLRRLVPVLRDDEVVLPPLLDAWKAHSFAGVVGDRTFAALVDALVAELRSERPNRPAGLDLVVPRDRARTPDTPLWTTLRVTAAETALVTEVAPDVSARHRGVTARLEHRLWQADRTRAAAGRTYRSGRPTGQGDEDLERTSREVGEALAEAFLPEPVAVALARRLAGSAVSGRAAHLALEISPDLADLPWETLVLDDGPLVLRPGVRVFRHAPGLGPTAQPAVPGPLRILAVVASPDDADAELLDYEHELAQILDQVERARREDAHVRILNWGSVDAIRQALTEEPFHVLHVSCHARPGVLVLETPDGRVDEVTARRFTDELRAPGRPVPFVVLAGCSTAQAAADLPALARGLIDCGVPAVLAMNSEVTDEYATEFLSRAYRDLASQEHPEPLVAVSEVRRLLASEHRSTPERNTGEWATPVLYQRVRQHRLFDGDHREEVVRTPRKALAKGIANLAIGDFVGRRADLRRLLRELRQTRGVLVHGMGGVGKSSLAAELVHLLGLEERLVVVTRHGVSAVDDVLDRLHRELRRHFGRGRAPADLDDLRDRSLPWPERLEILDEDVLPLVKARVVLFLDDPLGDPLEDPAAPPERPPDLDDFLAAWLRLGRNASLVVTSRMPFVRDPRRLAAHHLGPLSAAETRKLIFRLPALDALPAGARLRAYHAIGGHPRALEYLDAVLRGGQRRKAPRGSGDHFAEVAERLEKALRRAGVADVDAWWPTAGRDLDRALAETTAIASADVLLDDLYAALTRSFPLAAELLDAASVFRRPVEREALGWVVAPEREVDPDRRERLAGIYRALLEAERRGTARSRAGLPLSHQVHAQVNRDLAAAVVPPERPGLAAARDRLTELTLLTPVDEGCVVHRWTAGALAARTDREVLRAAHRRAAEYHRWRADLWRAELPVRLAELEEARHHSWQAKEPDQALTVTAELCTVLDRAGALDAEWSLCAETLDRTGPDDPRNRVFHHRRSVIALRRGRFDLAEAEQLRAQEIATAVGDLVAVAVGLQQLGAIAQARGDSAAAEAHYRSAITVTADRRIAERFDARVVLAGCYERLGALAAARGDGDTTHRMSEGVCDVAAEIGDEVDSMTIHRDLAVLARACGDHAAAERHELRAQEVSAANVDVRRLIATAMLQLAAVHVVDRMFAEAGECLETALDLAFEVRDVHLQARCLRLEGDVQFNLKRFDEARATYQLLVERTAELEDRRGEAVAHQQLGLVWGALGELDAAREALRTAEAKDPLLVDTCRLTLGVVLADAGHVDEAVAVLRAGLREGTAELAIGFICRLGLLRLRGDDLAGAGELFAEGLRRAEEAGSGRDAAICLLAQGLIARAEDRSDDARGLYAAALDAAAAAPRVLAECLIRLGDLALEEGAVDAALEANDECVQALEWIVAPELRAEVLRQRGRCCAEWERYADAVGLLRAAAEAFAGLDRADDVLYCLVTLCWVAGRAGDGPAAADAAARLGRMVTGLRRSPAVVVAHLVAGDGALARGDLDQALDHYEQARVMALPAGVGSLLVDCAFRLAAHARLAEDDAKAEQRLQAGLAIARHRRDRVAETHVHRELGLVTGRRAAFGESAGIAYELGERALYEAAMALLEPPADEDLLRRRLAAASDELASLLWLRRRRALDGEAAFGDRLVARVGPSIDEVVRGLVALPSGLAAVSAVVNPSVG